MNIIEFNDGVSHIELKIRNNEVFLIEVNPRMCGENIFKLIKYCCNKSYIEQIFNIFSHREVNLSYILDKFGKIEYIIPHNIGTVKK